jgi:hypothetical protein
MGIMGRGRGAAADSTAEFTRPAQLRKNYFSVRQRFTGGENLRAAE